MKRLISTLPRPVSVLGDQLVAMRVVAGIDLARALRQPVERRHGEIKMAGLDQFRRLPVEEGDQQRGDMRAVDVGVGHDDDLLVAQLLFLVMRADAAAERLDEIGELLVGGELVARGAGDVQNLAAQRQDRLIGAVARLLGRAAGRIALDDKYFRALRGIVRAIRELAGQPQFAARGLARDVFFGAAAQPLLGALDGPIEQLQRVRGRRRRANDRRRRARRIRRCATLPPSSAGPCSGPEIPARG